MKRWFITVLHRRVRFRVDNGEVFRVFLILMLRKKKEEEKDTEYSLLYENLIATDTRLLS